MTLTLFRRGSSDLSLLSKVLKALNLCFASTVISITSVLNFSLAAVSAAVLGISLSVTWPSNSHSRMVGYFAYAVIGFGWIMLAQDEVKTAVWHWEVLSVWFAPVVCAVYAPLVIQAGIVCLLE